VVTAFHLLRRARNLPIVAHEGEVSYEAHEAGDSAFDKGFARLRISLLVICLAFIGIGFGMARGGMVGLLLAGVVAALMLSIPLIDRWSGSESWLKGWFGELVVAHVLANLPETYTVLHDVTVNGKKWNIDHIVVGPSGVWLIETKNWSGRIGQRGKRLTLDGYDKADKVRNAVTNAINLREYLHGNGISVGLVHALIVSVQSRVPNEMLDLDYAVVLGSSDVVPHIRDAHELLNADVVADVVRLMKGEVTSHMEQLFADC
jgi:hypothetical protein